MNNGPSQRQLRVGEQIRHIIAETLQRGHFHDSSLFDHSVTVTEVRVTPDLKHARAFVMSLGGTNMDEIIPALNDEAKTFQREINRQTNLKFTPRVSFVTDDSFAEAGRIEDIIRNLPKAQED